MSNRHRWWGRGLGLGLINSSSSGLATRAGPLAARHKWLLSWHRGDQCIRTVVGNGRLQHATGWEGGGMGSACLTGSMS